MSEILKKMNVILVLPFILMAIIGINGLPSGFSRRSGPDGDNLDPVGSARMRPVFLGTPTGVGDIRKDSFSSRQIGRQNSLEPELEAPDAPEHQLEAQTDDNEEELAEEDIENTEELNNKPNERQFGLPKNVIREQIHRERVRKQKLRNRPVIHPDSDALKGKGNQFIVDDPLTEMVAGGDKEANPFAQQTSFSDIIQQLFFESIGIK